MTKKRIFYIVLYIAFLILGTLFSFEDYCIYKTNISTDSDILFGLLHLLLVYGITFWIFIFLISKITLSPYGVTISFVIISIVLSVILDSYIYDPNNLPELYHFFHGEYQVYIFLLYSSVLSLFIFPMFLIGKEANKRKKAIEKATGRKK